MTVNDMRLIDADDIAPKLEGKYNQDMVRYAPTIDAVPVVHGRWVWKHRHHGGFRKYTDVDEFGETHTITVDERSECDEPYCPYCGKWNESVFRNFCPNCGARMDGEG